MITKNIGMLSPRDLSDRGWNPHSYRPRHWHHHRCAAAAGRHLYPDRALICGLPGLSPGGLIWRAMRLPYKNLLS